MVGKRGRPRKTGTSDVSDKAAIQGVCTKDVGRDAVISLKNVIRFLMLLLRDGHSYNITLRIRDGVLTREIGISKQRVRVDAMGTEQARSACDEVLVSEVAEDAVKYSVDQRGGQNGGNGKAGR